VREAVRARGKRTELALRFSTVAGGRGAADSVRDPRGFAVKFHTAQGNWDLVGNNTDLLHPIPASYRHMDGFGSHTYQWIDARGERFWVKFHFKTDQGIRCLTSEPSAEIAGRDPGYMHAELCDAIARGQHPSWTLKVQVMPEADAAGCRFNPFDLTQVWRYRDDPLIAIARLVLTACPRTTSPRPSSRPATPRTSCPASVPRPIRCCRRDGSPTAMRSATGSAATTRACR
jgi:catalase